MRTTSAGRRRGGEGGRWWWWLLLLSLLLLASVMSDGLIVEEKTITFKRTGVSVFQKFGFEEGGVISLSAKQTFLDQKGDYSSANSTTATVRTITKANATFFLCGSEEWRHFLSMAEDANSFCYVKQSSCEIDGLDINVVTLKNYRVKTKDYYRMVLVSCSMFQTEVSINYTMVNLNGEQLSYGDIILPRFFSVVCGVWTLALVVCLFCAIFYNPAPGSYLFKLFALLVTLKLLVNLSAAWYWSSCQSTGICINVFLLLQNVFFALSEAMFFSILLLISKGWKITREKLPSKEVRSIMVSISSLLAVLVFFSFYNETYPFLSLMILYFFMLPQIFRNVSQNVRLLHLQASLLRNPSSLSTTSSSHQDDDDDDDDVLVQQLQLLRGAIQKKLLVFRSIKISVLVYLGLILVVTMLKIVIVWYLDYTNYVVDEVIVICIFLSVLVGLKPHDSHVYTVITLPNLINSQFLDEFLNEDNSGNLSDEEDVNHQLSSPLLDDLSSSDPHNDDLSSLIIVVYPSSKEETDHVSELPLALACKLK
eukprot:TRINITY_DN341_c0_g1_i2.p1 TRINITY_DN341_c0_g1~~TRINITY_DN341_c0_g1_i2.p1  ORF type:complete len:537 (+),score=113.89 TRINITY_DN341_c0_g1_i2:64-1674(+)